jgi:hypothetical protein
MTDKGPYFPYAGLNDFHKSIEAGNSTLLRQAPMTADEYLHSAIDCIDERLGKGYAKVHPELIGAFMQTSAMDLGAAVIARAIENIGVSAISSAIEELQESLRSDHPLQGQTLDGIESALSSIASAIKDATRGDQK